MKESAFREVFIYFIYFFARKQKKKLFHINALCANLSVNPMYGHSKVLQLMTAWLHHVMLVSSY